jgi:hypothetical protein
MKVKNQHKSFMASLLFLLIVHSTISFGAYRYFTQKIVESQTSHPPLAITTVGQASQEKMTIVLTKTIVRKLALPTPVIFYVWFGYVGLASAVLFALFKTIQASMRA